MSGIDPSAGERARVFMHGAVRYAEKLRWAACIGDRYFAAGRLCRSLIRQVLDDAFPLEMSRKIVAAKSGTRSEQLSADQLHSGADADYRGCLSEVRL